ncbi:MAG: hypothetical protein PHZ04_00380 [Patescibacteria group bacterium]|nr:hypothetical protein [Patescibacteria group bacterium]MDD5555035.1 hypothetical protein [Patescibacteria group bacterium]
MKDEDRAEQSQGPCGFTGSETCRYCTVPCPNDVVVNNDEGQTGD